MADDLVHDLPAKLRVTAALLGCANQKDLCAAFRRVNPHTDFDLDRSYKWMQGRSLPRSGRLYQDWALVLGADAAHPAGWVAACSLAEFVSMLGARHGLAPEALARRAGLDPASVLASSSALAAGPDGYLCGSYACYSHAQSPYYRGRVVRGALLVEPASRRAQGLVATYSQAIATGRAHASGPVGIHGRTLSLELHAPGPGNAPVFCTLFLPSPPASVLAGMMCGAVAVDPGGQPPYATRIAMLRVRAAHAGLEASNRYLEAGEAVPGDLAALGVEVPDGAGLGALLDQVLRAGDGVPGSDRLVAADYAALAMACDRAWLG
jgi:hypothetical protein